MNAKLTMFAAAVLVASAAFAQEAAQPASRPVGPITPMTTAEAEAEVVRAAAALRAEAALLDAVSAEVDAALR